VDKLESKGYTNEELMMVATRYGLAAEPAVKPALIDYFFALRAIKPVGEDYVVVDESGRTLAMLSQARYNQMEGIIDYLAQHRKRIRKDMENRRLTIVMATPMSDYLAQYLEDGAEALRGYNLNQQIDVWYMVANYCKVADLSNALIERFGKPSSRPSTTTSGYGMRNKQLHRHGTSEQRQPLLLNH